MNENVRSTATSASERQIGWNVLMKFAEKFRGKWAKRLSVAAVAALALPGLAGVTGEMATAGAFSRPGLPVEYLDIPSAGMGRDIRIQFEVERGRELRLTLSQHGIKQGHIVTPLTHKTGGIHRAQRRIRLACGEEFGIKTQIVGLAEENV